MSMNYFKLTGAWFIDLTFHLMSLGFAPREMSKHQSLHSGPALIESDVGHLRGLNLAGMTP